MCVVGGGGTALCSDIFLPTYMHICFALYLPISHGCMPEWQSIFLECSPMCRVGQNHIYTVCIRYFGREITIHTVIYGVYIRFWPTLTITFTVMPCTTFAVMPYSCLTHALLHAHLCLFTAYFATYIHSQHTGKSRTIQSGLFTSGFGPNFGFANCYKI